MDRSCLVVCWQRLVYQHTSSSEVPNKVGYLKCAFSSALCWPAYLRGTDPEQIPRGTCFPSQQLQMCKLAIMVPAKWGESARAKVWAHQISNAWPEAYDPMDGHLKEHKTQWTTTYALVPVFDREQSTGEVQSRLYLVDLQSKDSDGGHQSGQAPVTPARLAAPPPSEVWSWRGPELSKWGPARNGLQ